MRRCQSPSFDAGLAAFGCLWVYPAFFWVAPFDVEIGWSAGPLAATFAACYAGVRVVDRVVSAIESEVSELVGSAAATRR